MTLKRHRLSKWLVGFVLSFLLLLSLVIIASLDVSVLASESAAIQAPLLKWQRGGCFPSWCQTGWYASPAVAVLDDDGQPEVIWASYDLVVLNGQDPAQGALARSVEADQADPLLAAQGEIDPAQHAAGGVGFLDPAGVDDRHGGSLGPRLPLRAAPGTRSPGRSAGSGVPSGGTAGGRQPDGDHQ